MGDGILVYFGYPRAHEDEAERSVRAGLDIVDAMAELNAAVPRPPPGVELAVRIGIATGPVIVGDQIGEGTASETAVVGETPNLAAHRVCMTAAMLVLEPIFEADLPPEIYAYRAGRNAQQGCRRGGGAAVPWSSGSRGRRPRGLLREPIG
jgi:hypothetical protein